MVDAASDISLHLSLNLNMEWISTLDSKNHDKMLINQSKKETLREKSTTDYIQFSSRNLHSQAYIDSVNSLKNIGSPRKS